MIMRAKRPEITVKHLYPSLTSEEQLEASESLARYVKVICGIYKKNQNLTGKDQVDTI
jgi:hypothetical protein